MFKYIFAALLLLLPALANAQTCAQADLNHPLSVSASWQDNSTDETGFVLERKLNAGSYSVLAASLSANLTSFTDSSVIRDVVPNTYTYRVKAIKALADGSVLASGYSNESCVTFAALPPAPPAAPSGLTVASISSSALRISWEDTASESGYQLEGRVARGNQSYQQVAFLPADTATFDWTGLKRYTPYCVRLRALSGASSSGYAGPACATTGK